MTLEHPWPSQTDVADAALREGAAPTLAITEQFFKVHALADDPVVMVEQDPDQGWHVTLRLRDVPYYWGCRVETQEGALIATWGCDVEDVRAYLSLDSDTLSPEEIEVRIGLPATRGFRIGEPRSSRPGSPVATYNWYTLDSPASRASGIDQHLDALFALLQPRADAVASVVGEIGGGVINVCYNGWQGSMGGVHLTADQAMLLGRMGLALDVDLYAEGPALLE